MNKLSFAINKFDLMDISNSELMKVRLWIVSEGDNQHEKPIPWTAIENARPTLIGKPVVAKYNRYSQQLMGHELDEVPVGVVLCDNDIFYEKDEEGKRWLCADGIIWCRYAKDVAFVLDRDQIQNLSMEIIVVESGDNNSIESFIFSGITLISTTPAIENARAEVLSFSKVKEEIEHLMYDFKIPSIVKQNAEKGIFLKQNNPKGATAVNVGIANQLINNEFVSLDLLHNIIKFSAKTKTETAQYLLGGFESLEWAENIINPQTEKFEEVKKEEEIVPTEEIEKLEVIENEQQEEMGADANVEAVAQAELADKQAETDKVLAEESKEQMAEEVVLEEKMTEETMAEEVIPKEDEDDFQAKYTDMSEKYEEMYNKYSALEVQMSEMTAKMSTSEDQMAIYMSENEQLKKFKSDIEEKEMLSVIEYTLTEVMESMPKEQMEELREDAKNFCASDLNIWVNKVKAEAFSFSKGKTNNDGIMKVGLPFENENNKTESKSLWDKI